MCLHPQLKSFELQERKINNFAGVCTMLGWRVTTRRFLKIYPTPGKGLGGHVAQLTPRRPYEKLK
jgi:hypothetical protein